LTQLFKVLINSADVTNKCETFSTSLAVGQVYHTATITISGIDNINSLIEKSVNVFYGDSEFNGIVFSYSRTGANSYTLTLRSNSAKFTEPFAMALETSDKASNSVDLCSLYALEYGRNINITSTNLNFDGDYARSGTPLDALRNIAAVTGADIYDTQTALIIEPKTGITGIGRVLSDSEYFDFLADTTGLDNKGVSLVVITSGTQAQTDIEVVVRPRIYAELDELAGKLFIFSSPVGILDSYTGMHFDNDTERLGLINRTEERRAVGIQDITTDGAISSIESITLNGNNVEDYSFESGYNKIWFSSEKFGNIVYNYTAHYSIGWADSVKTPDGNYIKVEMFYKDQYLILTGFIKENSNTFGNMSCILSDSLNYVQGFTFNIIGGYPQVEFFENGEIMNEHVFGVDNIYAHKENATLEPLNGTFQAFTRYEIDTATGARSYGVDINYTIDNIDGRDVFVFDKYYPNVEILYTIATTEFYVQFGDRGGAEVLMSVIDLNTQNRCESDLEGEDKADMGTLQCTLPATIPIDLARELSATVNAAAGKTISNPILGSYIADSFGVVYILINDGVANGDYEFNTSHIMPRTKIVFKLNI